MPSWFVAVMDPSPERTCSDRSGRVLSQSYTLQVRKHRDTHRWAFLPSPKRLNRKNHGRPGRPTWPSQDRWACWVYR